jgi:hypothetical protein
MSIAAICLIGAAAILLQDVALPTRAIVEAFPGPSPGDIGIK